MKIFALVLLAVASTVVALPTPRHGRSSSVSKGGSCDGQGNCDNDHNITVGKGSCDSVDTCSEDTNVKIGHNSCDAPDSCDGDSGVRIPSNSCDTPGSCDNLTGHQGKGGKNGHWH